MAEPQFVELLVKVDGGTVVFPDDLTLDETESLERTLECSWSDIQPLSSARHCRAVLLTLAARTQSWDDAVVKVGALTQSEAVALFELKPAEAEAPKAEGASSPG